MGVHTWGMQKNSKVLTIHLYGFFPGHTKRRAGPQLADRAETADHIHHIHKDATDRYAPCLRGGAFYVRCSSWRLIVAVFTVFL